MLKIKDAIITFLIFLMIMQSVSAISNVQHSVHGNKVTLTYQGTPPFMINIRPDKNIGQIGGYIWAKTYANSVMYDMSFAINPSKKFYYGVKDDVWSQTNIFYMESYTNTTNTCKKIFGNSNSYETMNIFFVGVNYDADQIVTANLDLNNWSINLQNDVNRFLFNPDEQIGYGLLTIEPFASKSNKINVYMITTPYKCLPCTYSDYSNITKLVSKNCEAVYKENLDKIVPILGYLNHGGTSISQASVLRDMSGGGNNHWSTVFTFVHEFGHDLGLFDNYGAAYNDNAGGITKPYTPVAQTDAGPNCDPTPGCPKWCNGTIKIPSNQQTLIPSFQECTTYQTKSDCQAHETNPQNTIYCVWVGDIAPGYVDPYFNASCVQLIAGPNKFKDIGVDCIGDDGCYWGCFSNGGGAGYRPRNQDQLTDQRVDSNNKKHHYSFVAERYVENIFDCCFNSDINNYNYTKCENFSKTRSLRSYLYINCNEPLQNT
ncbi:MAG: hypothetical protein KJ583_00005 [Nanoarchaeota archaeon]|nr:hypothetical protein [Nanoarchaeota archaeon]MBU1269591.1 hypothetical protein [Nanoarchaeota archaeon]MBU1603670.1 hypothetical protein [Nanoarchaeota archaeon]MBU2443849.1 hypothetical protein [Nanoarchaeota archaeon]